MGVGRALLLTDRVRKDYQEARKSGLGPVLGRLKDDAENIAGTVVGKVSGNGTEETARSAADSEISVGKPKPAASPARSKPATAPPSRPAATSRPKTAAPAPKPAATSKPAPPPKPSTPKPAAKPKPAPQAKATPQAKPSPQPKASAKPKAAEKPAATAKPRAKATKAADLPVTGYDGATLASVRARLRGLDAKQVGELRDYERSNAARADFLRMYENRIAKLKSER
jgi:outer membrane biosynthesis protein TonB